MFKLLLNLYILQFVLSQDFPAEDLLVVPEACLKTCSRKEMAKTANGFDEAWLSIRSKCAGP